MLNKIKTKSPFILFLYIAIAPLFYSLIYQRQREEDFIFCLFSSFLFTIPLYFFKNGRIYLTLSSITLLIAGLFDLVHVFLYQGRISSSIFFIILDTNPSESLEFISSNISAGLIFLIISYLGVFVYLFSKIIKSDNPLTLRRLPLALLIAVLLPIGGKYASSKGNFASVIEAYTKSNQLFLMTETYLDYSKQMKVLTEFSANAKDLGKIPRSREVNSPEIHVLVIGESTTRQHMSLYGYQRKTNPLLESIKDELIVFNDVANTHPPGTASNLKRILTLASSESDSSELLSINLLNIMKAAGFKTYWLSNQLILGNHDTVTTALANQADVKVFVNTTNSKTFDEKLLPVLSNKLNEVNQKKFIVLHLFGSHMKYRNRFPKNFERFNDSVGIKKMPFHDDKAIQYINDYDNAILYNDFIVFEILKRLKTRKELTSFIYLSDHGEEVYGTKDLHGHPPVGTKALYEIPFIFWGSEEFKRSWPEEYSKLLKSKNVPYEHDDLIHTLMDLYGIEYERFESSLSILNVKLRGAKRFVDSLE